MTDAIDRFRRGALGLLLPALLTTSAAVAREEVRQGVLYQGGTRLESSEDGVAFVVPKGWQAVWPAGSEFLVMQQPSDPDTTLLVTVQEASEAEIRTTMSTPIDLGDGIVLLPTRAVEQRGSALEASYQVAGAPKPLIARGAARSRSGTALAFVLVGPSETLDSHLGTFRELVDGAQLAAPAAPSAGGGGASGGSSGGGSDRWDAYLKGKYIVRYYTSSGYTDETHLWLCSDGSFYRRGAAGGFGGGASGAFDASSSGRWQATGAGANGTLILRYGDGSVAEHSLRWDYGESKLYVDDKRWLHGENERCR